MTTGALDFSMKPAKKSDSYIVESNSPTSTTDQTIKKTINKANAASCLPITAELFRATTMHPFCGFQLPLSPSRFLPIMTSPSTLFPSMTSPSTFSPIMTSLSTTKMTSPSEWLGDPALLPTTSLALSAIHRRRRRADGADAQDDGGKRFKPIPDDQKTESYWERRRKNNEAAKRSRDSRKAKEDEIAMRAAFLEQENLKLKAQVHVLKNEMGRLHCLLFNPVQP